MNHHFLCPFLSLSLGSLRRSSDFFFCFFFFVLEQTHTIHFLLKTKTLFIDFVRSRRIFASFWLESFIWCSFHKINLFTPRTRSLFYSRIHSPVFKPIRYSDSMRLCLFDVYVWLRVFRRRRRMIRFYLFHFSFLLLASCLVIFVFTYSTKT